MLATVASLCNAAGLTSPAPLWKVDEQAAEQHIYSLVPFIHELPRRGIFSEPRTHPVASLTVRTGAECLAEGLVSLPHTQPMRPRPSPDQAVLAAEWFVSAPVQKQRGKSVRV
jgi:hypothetical protein